MNTVDEYRPQALSVSLEPELFHAVAYHSRRFEMSPKAFLAHLARSYVTAMSEAKAKQDKGR